MAYLQNKDPDILQAIRVINSTYGDNVSIDQKKKNLLKYGLSDQVQTSKTTIMELPSGTYNETYVRQNDIDKISSSNASDTVIVTIEGHTVGSNVSVSTLTQTAGTATCTTGAAHGYSTGEWIYIDGANEAAYNGIKEITVTGTTTFTFTIASGTASPATGTITATTQNKTFVVQDATLNGQTQVTLSTPLARATRVYVKNQTDATDLVGDVYVYYGTATAGVPNTASQVHLMATGTNGNNQSQKASTSLSWQDYWIITEFHAHWVEKGAGYADVVLEVREEGGVFRQKDNVVIGDGSQTGVVEFRPYLIVRKNSDIRLRGTASAAGKEISGSIEGYLAIVV